MDMLGYNSDQRDKQYLHQLLDTAVDYISDYSTYSFYEISFFYCNKSEDYFSEVRRNNNVLKKLLKDNNGDPRSPINGKLSGVFLSVTLFQGRFPSRSPFGDTRVHIPIEAIFRESSNLYFTDFYCYGTTTETHYVTLVLTPRGSKEDIFCMKTLLRLDPVDNPFLRRSKIFTDNQIPTFFTVRKSKLFVEVFYTEDIDLDQLTSKYGPENVFYSTTGIIGRGHSTWGGLRKNAYCTVCNPRKLSSVYSRHLSIQSFVLTDEAVQPINEVEKPTVKVQPQVRRTNTEEETVIKPELEQLPKPVRVNYPAVLPMDVKDSSLTRTVTSSTVHSSRINKQSKKGCCTIL